MFSHSTNTASFFSVLMAALIFSLSLAGVAAAQGNTSLGINALGTNTTGNFNTAIGLNALFSNSTGSQNTANGVNALVFNTTGGQQRRQRSQRTLQQHHGQARTPPIGVHTLFSNTTGNNNTASGFQALYKQHHGRPEHRQRSQCAL